MPYITTEQVKEKRQAIKKAFPEFKFSITMDNYSGIRIAIMEGPSWFAEDGFHKSMNGWSKVMGNEKSDNVVNTVYSIANGGNGVEVEDGDYGTVPNFYIWMSVGKWDKPYKGREAKKEKIEVIEEIAPVELSPENCEEMTSIEFEEKANKVIEEQEETAPEMGFASIFGGTGERKEIETKGLILEKHLDLAIRAHNGVSFSPERRGKQYIRDYSEMLEEDLKTVKKFEGDTERYREKFERLFCDWMHSKSNCISSMITGPARFPTSRAQKRNGWERNKSQALYDWREKALKAIKRNFKKQHAPDPLTEARQRLKKHASNLESMKAVNKIARSKKIGQEEKVRLIIEMGYGEGAAYKLITPDYMGVIGFASFSLTNCRNRMKAAQDRVTELESRAASTNEEVEREDGIRVVENVQENRLQVFFPGKPEADIRKALKSNGFRWAPSKGCWQSYLNSRAIDKLNSIL